jgi:glyoxylate reductase
MPKVLITNAVPAEHVSPLDGVAEVVMGPEGGELMPRDEVLRMLPELDAVINQAELKVDDEVLERGKRLKIVANVAMGTDNMDKEAMARRGIWATNTPEVFTQSTADHAFCLLLAVARRLMEADPYVRSGQWPGDGFQPGVWDGMLLAGKVMGVLGYGHIGRAVAHRARAFGMHVLFHDPVFGSHDPFYRGLDALFEESDVVTLHVPLTPETKGLVNAERLAAMKRGAILLNLARGPVVEEAALAQALESGQLAGAGLDVFEDEPRVHPDLLEMKNVVMTPHVGGGTRESRAAARKLSAVNVALALHGKRPRTPVNEPESI